jgi:hypothetical protein
MIGPLLPQAHPDAVRRVALLARRLLVRAQHLVNELAHRF